MSTRNRWGGFRTRKEMLVGLVKLPVEKHTPINYKALNTVPQTHLTGEALTRYRTCEGIYKKSHAKPRDYKEKENVNTLLKLPILSQPKG